MRFYTQPHPFYCGIDLHARTMYVCMVNRDGEVLLHRNMKAAPEPFLQAIAPIARTSSSASNASSPGTGSPTCVRKKTFPSSSATPSL